MNFVVYEHPLNQKVRVLMRLELLFWQLQQYRDVQYSANIYPFFKSIYDCIEVLERNDVRGTLTHYLDLLEKSMIRWSQHPDVKNDSLQEKLKQAVNLQNQISTMTKACQQLKDDKFLASLRQRFGIAGGICDFDLPQLHFWRQKTEADRAKDVESWLDVIKPLEQSLDFALMFLRESNKFVPHIAENGFFQDSCSESASLLRIRYDMSYGNFPMVSGSNRRFSISFMQPDKCSVKTTVDDTIPFELATC